MKRDYPSIVRVITNTQHIQLIKMNQIDKAKTCIENVW